MPENDAHQLSQLLKQITDHFNDEELRTLCFQVGVAYDDLGGRGRAANARELVQWAKRNNRVPRLMAEVKAARPNVPAIVALLPPHHIPYRRNTLFTGREEWLTKLHTALHQEEPVAVTQAVAGLGGVGKTQLALAYCYRHLADYDLIQWLRADDATTLGTALADLAYRLGLARPSVTDQPALHQLVLNWLHSSDQRWLLVYDNADAIQHNDLRPFLPKMGQGACLITSRNPNWGTLARTMRLTHFSPAEAVAFLLGLPQMTNDEMNAHPHAAAAQALAERLGYLPLALEHARAYVDEAECSLADYGGYFETERAELWGDELPAPANYDEKTITTTWELAFAQAKQTPGAAELLNLCCFLAPDDIPLLLLTETAQTLPEETLHATSLPTKKLALDKAIAALRRYSLLTRDGDRLTLHRLVQTVARDQMPPELRQRWAEVAVNLLLEAWPYDHHDLTTWEPSGEFLPHLLAAAEQAENVDPLPEKTGLLLNQAGYFLYHRAAYDLTLNLWQRALEMDEKAYGPEHPTVAVRLNNLGQLLKALGDYEAARPYMERALAIWVKALGPDHPQVAKGNNNLATLLQAVGEYEAARPYMERALTISEKALGSDHPDVAIKLNNLGQLLQDVGDYAAARPYMERALTIFEKNLGEDHPNVATLNNNLGNLLQAVGEYEAARPYLEHALEISEKALGSDHPDVAIRLNNLATLLQDVGEYEAARPYLERALAISEKALGPDHPTVAIRLNNLGQLLQDVGEYEAARPYMERALAIDEKALGPDHPEVATDLNNLGQLLQAVGEYEAARPYLERALAIDEKALGPDHPDVAIDLNNLATLLQAVGEYEAARPYLERALAISEKALGPDHPDVAIRLNNLGQLLQAVGEYEAARPYMERALVIFEKNLGADHPNVATLNNNLGQLLQAVGEYEAARPYMERALAIFEKNLGVDHPNVATLNNNLGWLLKTIGEYEAARPYMERALAIDEKALGPDHPDVAIRLNNLGQLMQAVGEYEAARPLIERALAIFEAKLGLEHPSTNIVRGNLAALLQEMEGK